MTGAAVVLVFVLFVAMLATWLELRRSRKNAAKAFLAGLKQGRLEGWDAHQEYAKDIGRPEDV